jgi:hypothetical protein
VSALDLRSELAAAESAVRQQHLDHIRALGVAPATVAELGRDFPSFGVATIEMRRDTYAPGPGPAAFVHPVVADGAIVDLLAWRSLQPERWWLRLGVAWALGIDNLTRHDLAEPLRIADTPLNWLRGGARGICIVDYDSPEIRSLQSVDAIEVDNGKFGELLLREISRPARVPRVVVERCARAS